MPAATLTPSRLAPADAVRAAGIGLRTRRLRSLLSALGIMIGIAAMVAVLGLSESSKSDLLAQLDGIESDALSELDLRRLDELKEVVLSATQFCKASDFEEKEQYYWVETDKSLNLRPY